MRAKHSNATHGTTQQGRQKVLMEMEQEKRQDN